MTPDKTKRPIREEVLLHIGLNTRTIHQITKQCACGGWAYYHWAIASPLKNRPEPRKP